MESEADGRSHFCLHQLDFYVGETTGDNRSGQRQHVYPICTYFNRHRRWAGCRERELNNYSRISEANVTQKHFPSGLCMQKSKPTAQIPVNREGWRLNPLPSSTLVISMLQFDLYHVLSLMCTILTKISSSQGRRPETQQEQ